jgi:hypothetical protein
MKYVAAFVIAAAFAGSAHAQTPAGALGQYDMRAEGLTRNCGWGTYADTSPSPELLARCQARTLGEVDGVIEGMKLSHTKPWICMLPDTDLNERQLVVKKYIDDHPESLSADLGDVVGAALAHAFPCHR